MKKKKLVFIADAFSAASAFFPHGLNRAVPLALLTAASLNAETFITGYLRYDYFPGALRTDVLDGTAGEPSTAGSVVGSDKSGYVASFESGTNFADNYANRISGLFVPPTTGDYVFFIAGDDDTDLFLSTDADPANKRLIAQESGWSGVRSYLSIGGGSVAEDKRSDTFSFTEWPGGNTINLTAGNRYYIEAVHHEGGGGDNLAATYKLASEADPGNGSAPRFVGSVVGVNVETAPPASSLSIAVHPAGGTFYSGQPTTLLVGASSDSPYPILYQWRKDGANIAGANSARLSIASTASSDAGSYDVVVSVPGPTGELVNVTSAAAVVTVENIPEEFVVGQLRYDYFPGGTRATVFNGTAGPPSFAGSTVGSDRSGFVTSLESGTNFADNYANRFSGFFIPPTTGDYVFYIAGDDDSDLFLSTDDNPANKKLIAQESGWSGVRVYNAVGGGSVAENKRSDYFEGTEWPSGSTISLTAGNRYYLEAVHHEGGGGDNLAATYRLSTEDESLTDDGTAPRLTGSVIGTFVPQILSIGAAPANIARFAFTITDSGTSVLDPATVKLTLDGNVVVPTPSPKVGTSTTYTYTFPTRLLPESTHFYTIQVTDTTGHVVTSTDTFTLPRPWFPAEDLKSPGIVDKAWASRFIHEITDADLNPIQATGLANIIRIINQVGTPAIEAIVTDITTPVVNFNAGGLFGDPIPYPDEIFVLDDFINLNVGHIVIAEEDDYTFGVQSDDGFAMRIRGGEVVRVSGNGQADPSDLEAVVHPNDTGNSSTRAVYHLRPGVYRIEFFWWERGGGDFGEIYAARGNFANDGDTSTWRLVGDPTPSQELTLLGVDSNGWSVISSDPGGEELLDWSSATADLDATGGGAKNYDFLHVGDPDTNGGVQAFPKDVPGVDDNDFALIATATLVVPQTGTYLLGFNSDDGAYLKLDGQTFLEITQNNTEASYIAGDTVTCDCLTGDSGTLATVTLAQGTYPIEVGMFERGGGAFLTARGALVPANPVTTGEIPPLAKGAAGTKVNTPSALQLTNAPVSVITAPTLAFTYTGGNLVVTYTGTLQSASALNGTFTDVAGATSPYTVPLTAEAAGQYFRAHD